jgi:hypothetical protein
MEFQMRNKTFISSMVGVAAAVAVAGSANASLVFDDFQTGVNTGVTTSGSQIKFVSSPSWSTPNPVSGLTGSRVAAVNGYSATAATSAVVGSGVATLQAGQAGGFNSQLGYYGTGANLTGYVFTLNVSATTGSNAKLVFSLANAAGTSQIESALNGTGTYIFSVSSFGGGYDATSITALAFGLQTLVGGSGGASMTFDSFTYAVPAPGALALLGVAGIVGARRRRA